MSSGLLLATLLYATLGNAQTIDEAIARAIAHSPELRAMEAAVAEARANAMLGDAFRSSASVAATPGYASGLPTAVLGQVPAIGTVEAHRLFYDPSARAAQIGAASEIDTAIARLELRKREVAQTTAELYARVTADAVLVTSAQRRVKANETIASRTEALRSEGRVRDLDVDRALLQLATARRSLVKAQSQLDLDQLRLARMWGPASEDQGRLKPALTLSSDDPELRALDARIEAVQRAQSLQNRRFQPSIAGQIQYSRLFDRFRRYYLNFKPDDLSVGATVTLPIWTGGHRDATSARLAAQLQQLVAQRDARRSELELATREAEADLTQAAAEADLAAHAHKFAVESLRIAEELAREGRGEPNDVPLAEIALADADDDVANVNAHLLTARARLSILRGDLRIVAK